EPVPPFETVRLRKGGDPVDVSVSVSPVRDAAGRVVGASTIARDITERKRAEEALRSAEALFSSLVEQSLVGIHIIQNGRYAYASHRLAAIVGYSQPEVLALPSWLDLVAEADRGLVAEHVRRRLSGGVPSAHYPFRGRRKDGTVIDVEVHGSRTEFRGAPA